MTLRFRQERAKRQPLPRLRASSQRCKAALVLCGGWALSSQATCAYAQSQSKRAALAARPVAARPAPNIQKPSKPIPIKVVIVAAYETGDDEGDTPGELQLWVEREHLTRHYPFAADHDLRGNDQGVLAIVTGVGTAKAAASVMALGLDPRFDLSHAYWLVAGIAGGDPADTTLGSAVWAEWVVDADLSYEIDAREMPSDWSTGRLPLHKTQPFQGPPNNRGEAYHLNPQLRDWAYELTKGISLPDSSGMATYRARFGEFARARQSPSVMKGDTLSGSTFWHGRKMNRWANDWTRYWTGGQGNYTTCAMEDTGTLQALTQLSLVGRVDKDRVMVLRAVTDFDSPPADMTAAESLVRGREGAYFAYGEALEAAHRVGSRVVGELVSHWSRYQKAPPSP